jgi:hypothetical protein
VFPNEWQRGILPQKIRKLAVNILACFADYLKVSYHGILEHFILYKNDLVYIGTVSLNPLYRCQDVIDVIV